LDFSITLTHPEAEFRVASDSVSGIEVLLPEGAKSDTKHGAFASLDA